MTRINYATNKRWQNRVRWSIAHHLNKLPQTCWTYLVSWALHDRTLLSRYGGDIRQDVLCRIEEGCHTCYCGKLKKDVV
jgi:hypothetical protein